MAREKICGIYCIKNLTNCKVYIGSSMDVNRRIRKHKELLNKNKHENRYLQNSWNKHGKDNFIFNCIESFKFESKEKLLQREQYWIDYYNASNRSKGYNILSIAGSSLGFKLSNEAKEKISKSKLGCIPWNVGYGDYISGNKNPMFGKSHSDETKEKIRKNHLGKKASKEAIINMKKSSKKGEENNKSKLTEDQVILIKVLLNFTNLDQRTIGDLFDINQRTISAIKLGKLWSHVNIDNFTCN